MCAGSALISRLPRTRAAISSMKWAAAAISALSLSGTSSPARVRAVSTSARLMPCVFTMPSPPRSRHQNNAESTLTMAHGSFCRNLPRGETEYRAAIAHCAATAGIRESHLVAIAESVGTHSGVGQWRRSERVIGLGRVLVAGSLLLWCAAAVAQERVQFPSLD